MKKLLATLAIAGATVLLAAPQDAPPQGGHSGAQTSTKTKKAPKAKKAKVKREKHTEQK